MMNEKEQNIITNQDKINRWAKLHGIGEDKREFYALLLANFTDALERMDSTSEEYAKKRDELRSLCCFFFNVEPGSPFAMFFSFFAEGYTQGITDSQSILGNTTKAADKK